MTVHIGTAGWSMPGEGDSHLVRYARQLNCCEINSTFRSRHRPATYQRWHDTVGPDFPFAVKLPEALTHKARLVDCQAGIDEFLADTAPLAEKRRVLLVQTPPSLAFDRAAAEVFFGHLGQVSGCAVVYEPRHPTWFTQEADDLLIAYRVARVAADPAPVEGAAAPGGWTGLRYYRWHGSPRVYYSSYDSERLEALATELRAKPEPAWCIFDNTAHGAGAPNALELRDMLAPKMPVSF